MTRDKSKKNEDPTRQKHRPKTAGVLPTRWMNRKMKKPIWKYIRILLEVAGAIALVALVALVALNYRQFSGLMGAHKPEVDQLTPKRAMFVLNWGNIGDKAKIEKIIHSYESPRSLGIFRGHNTD